MCGSTPSRQGTIHSVWETLSVTLWSLRPLYSRFPEICITPIPSRDSHSQTASILWQCVKLYLSLQPGRCSLTCQKHLFSRNCVAVTLKTETIAKEVTVLQHSFWLEVCWSNIQFHFNLYLPNTRYILHSELGTLRNTKGIRQSSLGNTKYTHWIIRTNKG